MVFSLYSDPIIRKSGNKYHVVNGYEDTNEPIGKECKTIKEAWASAAKAVELEIATEDHNRSLANISYRDLFMFIIHHSEPVLMTHNGPDFLRNATKSTWALKTTSIIEGTNEKPKDIEMALREAILKSREIYGK